MKKLSHGTISVLLAAAMLLQLGGTFAADDTLSEGDASAVEKSVEEDVPTEISELEQITEPAQTEEQAQESALYGTTSDVTSGTLSTGLTWKVYGDGSLVISGTGAIPDFTDAADTPWYASADAINAIIVGDGVTAIGTSAFRSLACVEYVELSSTVKTIGAYAFDNCTALVEIDIQSGVTSVGAYAFGYCYSLESIALPDSVTSIGIYAFYKCKSLTGAELPDGIAAIPMGLFEGCYMLSSIDWPSGVTAIGESAFAGCSLLNYVLIPETVTTVEARAFAACEWLYSLGIPASVTAIGEDIVAESQYATLVVYKDSAAYTYAKDNSLTFTYFYEPYVIAFGVCGDNLVWDLYDNGDMYITGTGAMYAEWTGTDHATWYEYRDVIKNVYVESGATSIGAYAFYNCKNLELIDIPSSVTSIGAYAFGYCESLRGVVLPDAVKAFPAGVFYNCKSLEYINPSLNTTTIGDYAFAGCEKLAQFDLGSKLTTVGTYAFYNCKKFTSISLSNSSVKIGDYAFLGCTSLTSISVASGSSKYITESGVLYACKREYSFSSWGYVYTKIGVICYPAGKSGTSFTVPSTVTSISPYAFAYADNLKSVTIGSAVTTVGANAFMDCDGLTSVNIPTNVTSIGAQAFYECDALEKAIFNSATVTINGDLFYRTADNFVIYGYEGSTAETFAAEKLYTFIPLTATDTELTKGMGKWTGGAKTSVDTNEYAHFGVRATNSSKGTIQTVDAFEVGTTYKLSISYRNNDSDIAPTLRLYFVGAATKTNTAGEVVAADLQLSPNPANVAHDSGWQTAEFTFTPAAVGTGAFTFCGSSSRLHIQSIDIDDLVISVVEPVSGSVYSAGEVVFSTDESDMYTSYYKDWYDVTITGGSAQTEVTEYMKSEANGDADGVGKIAYELYDGIAAESGSASVSAYFRVSSAYTRRILTYVDSRYGLNYVDTNYNGVDVTAKVYFSDGTSTTATASGASADTLDAGAYVFTKLTFPFTLSAAKTIVKVEFTGTGLDIVNDGIVVTNPNTLLQYDNATYTTADVQKNVTDEPFDVYGISVNCTLAEDVIEHVHDDAVIEDYVEGSCFIAESYDEVIYCAICGIELVRTHYEEELVGGGSHTPAAAVKENIVEGDCTTDGSYDEVVYCDVCDEEISRTTVIEKAPGHQFEDGYCYVCDAPNIIEGFETDNLINVTGGAAVVTAPTSGWIADVTNTFYVSCDKVCRVFVTHDGVTYTRLSATAASGRYRFKTTLTENSQIIIRFYGDVNGDGRIMVNDYTLARRLYLDSGFATSALNKLAADNNKDGTVASGELNLIRRVYLGSATGAW